jgi:hypothetical protein
MSKVRRCQRARLQSYVDAALAKQLAAYSAATGITASAVVQAALRQYLDKTGDATLIMRRLDRLGRAGARTQRDLEIQMEAFALWVKVWFAHTPSIPDDGKDYARRTAESRFAQFQRYLVEQFQGGSRFVDDLPREVIADEAELADVASGASTPPAAPTHAEQSVGTDEE